MKTLSALVIATSLFGLEPSAMAEDKPTAKGAPAETTAPAAESVGPTSRYVHKWLPLPKLAGAPLPAADGLATIESKPGRATIVIFIASWCEPCQQLVPELRKIEQRYKRLDADFHYVFAHDTLDDATGFMREFGIDRGLLANHEILKAYHNPDLPTIYVGDRFGWMMSRYLKATAGSLSELDDSLKYLTAY